MYYHPPPPVASSNSHTYLVAYVPRLSTRFGVNVRVQLIHCIGKRGAGCPLQVGHGYSRRQPCVVGVLGVHVCTRLRRKGV